MAGNCWQKEAIMPVSDFVVLLLFGNMLKPDFHISNGETSGSRDDYSQYRLLMELNARSFSYVLLNVRGMRPAVIKYFQWNQFKDSSIDEIMRDIVFEDEILTLPTIGEIFLVYNFPESSLVPERLFHPDLNQPLTDLVYGNLDKGLVINEKIPWWEFENVYRIPANLHKLMQQKFSSGKFWHFYSLQLKCHKMFTAKEENQLMKVFFYSDKMIVMVCRNGQLELFQSFSYQDSNDVAYNLLNCARQLRMEQEEISLQLSGLIEMKSALYEELQKYFLHITFDQLGDNIRITDEMREYPLHYFSSLLKMAICV
ncbi:MAG: hypothetical protein C5B59_03115 [Bacteroidetes bacterium]|nr:MAG: hypothetical protein C5B59_03115 [Bacteroidota bacterium]